jgi:peptidoglycan L-alanyl-D-glutamate endopeptidase CwlK
MGADRDLTHLYPDFEAKVRRILEGMNAWSKVHFKDHSWIVVEGFRTAKYQHELWLKGRGKPGRIVTYKDGYEKRSNHQSSLAADIVPKRGWSVVWDPPKAAWDYLAHLARQEGLESGNDWKTFVDSAHVEWPTTDRNTYILARAWQKKRGLA